MSNRSREKKSTYGLDVVQTHAKMMNEIASQYHVCRPNMQTCICTPDDCRTCADQVVCRCLQVTEEQIVVAITTLEIRSLRDLRRQTGAGDGCTACHRKLKSLVAEHAPFGSFALCPAS